MSDDRAPAGADLAAAAAYLRSTAAIRKRTGNILAAVRAGRSNHFRVVEQRLDAAAQRVVDVTRARYPDGRIPYHSRWRHFEAGSVDRYPSLLAALGASDPAERARCEIDLAVVSVLLDAGAGADWQYREAVSGQRFTRSEGLGVASFHAFLGGLFSGEAGRPLRADAVGLARITESAIETAFQASRANPLIGVAGRAQLMRRLGRALQAQPGLFGAQARPGGLFDVLTGNRRRTSIAAGDLLVSLLVGFGPIWPAENRLGEHLLGDTWPHPLAGGSGPSAGRVPFHKLSQWLTYSLLEPFERAGVTVTGLNDLTALAEYRNGGLLLDTGVIEALDPALAGTPLPPSAEPIIEWRALTVALLDALAERVRDRMGMDASSLPLAKILEGGTWATGRELANERRKGAPPLNIVSDGTVF